MGATLGVKILLFKRKSIKKWTFFIVSSADEPVMRFRLPKFLIKTSLFSLLAVIVALSYFLQYYYGTSQELQQKTNKLAQSVDQREEKIENLQQEVATLHSEAEQVERKVEKLESLESQLRSISDLSEKESIQTSSVQTPSLGGMPIHGLQDESDASLALHNYEALNDKLPDLIERYESTLSHVEELREQLRVTPTIWPTSSRKITSGYGNRRDPFTYRMDKHTGLDIGGAWGTPIIATADGRVVLAQYDGGYGRSVMVKHSSQLRTRYAHMSRIIVSHGDEVTKGQTIGYMGNSGRSTGVHLHYEILKYGQPVDPYPYLPIN